MISVSTLNMVVCFTVAAFDFSAGALIFVVSLVAAHRTHRNYFMSSFHCVPIFKTFLTAHWSFTIFVNFTFCLFSQDFYESQSFIFFEGQQDWSGGNVFGFYPSCFWHIQEVVLFL